MNQVKKVIAYFDGYNYYEGMRAKRWRKYYWQDLQKFAEMFLKPYQELEAVRYFSAVQKDVQKASRQDDWFQANRTNKKFSLTLGEFKRRSKWRKVPCGNKKVSYQMEYWEEKKSDVALASYMIRDVALDRCETMLVFCADSDLSPAYDVIRELKPTIKIITLFPPGLNSYDLMHKSTKVIRLESHEDKFKNSQFPDDVKLPNGHVVSRPGYWKG
jgi:uncharacterized LabA/DUF88 family protein